MKKSTLSVAMCDEQQFCVCMMVYESNAVQM